MLLQTNSYIVPPDKRAEHARLLRRFRQVLTRLGCDHFEVYEQVGSNWNAADVSGRVVQIMRFRDRRHQLAVQATERNDPVAQAVIAEFCQLINFPYQQQQGLFAVGFYQAVLQVGAARAHEAHEAETAAAGDAAAAMESIEAPAPAVNAEEPVFAEGTEGIIAAAEKLSDEQLDAGGEEAVAEAIAAASSNGAGEHVEEIHAPEAPQPQQEQPETPPPAQLGGSDDFDLAALLDPHIDPEPGEPRSNANGNPRAGWADDLSLGAALARESGHQPDHVAQ